MSKDLDLASQRYALLVRHLAEGEERGYGYKSKIARALGVHPSYIARVEAGGQKIGEHTIERAIERLGLRRDFFTDESLINPNPGDFTEAPQTEAGFGARLVALYEARGFTKASFARAAGVAYNTIDRCITGATSPVLPTLRAMARALGVSVSELIGEDELARGTKPLAPAPVDPELAVMSAIAALDPLARTRVLQWAADRFSRPDLGQILALADRRFGVDQDRDEGIDA